MRVFFDSNVILYSAGSDLAKAQRSDELMQAGGWISVQVLNEIANVSRVKMRYDWVRTRALLDVVKGLTEIVDLTREIHEWGLDITEHYKLSIWDGFITAAALIAGCDILYSEDMHHGLVVGGRLRIANPFDQTPR